MSESNPSSNRKFTGDLPTPYPRHVQEFQELYQKHFGIRLTSEQALEQLISLLVIVNYRQHSTYYKDQQRKR